MDIVEHQIQCSFQRTGHDEFSADAAAVDDSGVGANVSLQFKPGECFVWVLAEFYRAWDFKALPNRHFINSVTVNLNFMLTSCREARRKKEQVKLQADSVA